MSLSIIKINKMIPTWAKVYFSGVVGFNIVKTYVDSKQILLHYRQYEDDENSGMSRIKNEIDVVKFKAEKDIVIRLFDSLFWPVLGPILIINHTIPSVVVYFNPKNQGKKNE